jgi:hypothetical protein
MAAACLVSITAPFFRSCGAVNSDPTTSPCAVNISTGTRPAFSSNLSRAGAFVACRARTKAVPTLGWPAKGSSARTVKMRTLASLALSAGGRTKVVSE